MKSAEKIGMRAILSHSVIDIISTRYNTIFIGITSYDDLLVMFLQMIKKLKVLCYKIKL